jgi:thioester reductase-like protein
MEVLVNNKWRCRYDVAFDTNVMGAKHICEFAKRYSKLKMLLHVSTGRKQQSCVPFHVAGSFKALL